MKIYDVYFKEPISYTHTVEVFNKETMTWEDKEVTEMKKSIRFYSLAPAKRLIKANLDKYAYSTITKIWSDGGWENLGEIKLSGSNKTYIANTKQTKAGY